MFQQISNPMKGSIDGNSREPHLGARIGSLNVPAALFAATKANRKFINDPVPALYMAVHLYTHTWPTQLQYGGRKEEITVTPTDTAEILRQEFRVGSKDDIRRALDLLVAAGLAADNKGGTWVVSPKPPRTRGGDRDLAQVLARMAAEKPSPIVRSVRAKRAPSSEQDPLF